MQIIISTGRSRRETRWHIQTEEWSWLVDHLRDTTRTAETTAEYFASDRERRSEIKDVGGFVGGAVVGGRRKQGAVKQRTLITLDMDYAAGNVWDDITMLYGCAMCLYSTHSHKPEAPRYRLIIPLDRAVDAEEYEAAARKVAEGIGIDMFDDSTYQAERLMYWPSTPKDEEYIFREQQGNALKVDDVLAEYPMGRWQDVSQWPTSSRIANVRVRQMSRKGEPTERPGIVGRFCRAYTVSEAIETFLSDVYTPAGNTDGRYTYAQGTSSGGLVVYDDKFAYSHHATDPAGNQMCNAFDLVRIHKYGERDNGTRPDTAINRMPSYLEMERLVGADERVLQEQNAEIQMRLRNDFADVEQDNAEWMNELERDKAGQVKSTVQNILLILNNADGLKGNIRVNELTGQAEAIKDLPWRKVCGERSRAWTNSDDARLRVYLERVYGIHGKDRVIDSFTDVAEASRYHPIKEYLQGLRWDNTPRVDTLLIDYLGADDTPLTRAVTRKFMVAAVARVSQPGCKFDYVTVLQGAQGIGKSTLLHRLAGDMWFNDSLIDIGSKDAMANLQGSWIIELGELQAIKKSDIENTKAFLSKREDIYRPAYGRIKECVPRQCIFFATTNETSFLKGSDGNRRFWIVPCHAKNADKVFSIDETLRAQLWAEAYHIYKQGEVLTLPRELEKSMRKRQETYNEITQDVRKGVIEEFLDKKLPAAWPQMDTAARAIYLADEAEIEAKGTWQREYVCVAEILVECFHERLDDKTRYKSNEIMAIMKQIQGWKKSGKVRWLPGYGVQRCFERIRDNEEESE